MIFNKEIHIGKKIISNDSRTFIVGEAGVNHNGNPQTARDLIDVAVEAGVDAVKFQMFRTDELILPGIEKAPYQKETTDAKQSQFEMLKSLELQSEIYGELKRYCDERGIIFLCTPFEKKSLDALEGINVLAYKVAATDITNIQFLRQVAQKNKPIMLSAGMCYLEEIDKALNAIYSINKDVVLMQCTANYPIEDEEANLNVIDTLISKYNIIIGYSDHSKGIGAAPYAVAKGAKVVEKHFTLDRHMDGPDQKASVTPDELKAMVNEIRRVERYLGDGVKMSTCSEQQTRKSLQKCFVAAEEIKKDEVYTENNIVAKRTNGRGVSAVYYDELLGKKATREYRVNDIIDTDL